MNYVVSVAQKRIVSPGTPEAQIVTLVEMFRDLVADAPSLV